MAGYTLAGLMLLAPMTSVVAADKPSFDEVDADGDGRVAIGEVTEVGVPKSEAEREDIDNDGELTKAGWKFVDMSPDSGDGSGSS